MDQSIIDGAKQVLEHVAKTPRVVDTEKWASAIKKRLVDARPACDECEFVGFDQMRSESGFNTKAFVDNGFRGHPTRAGLYLPCEKCEAEPLYPWAHGIDVAKLAALLDGQGLVEPSAEEIREKCCA